MATESRVAAQSTKPNPDFQGFTRIGTQIYLRKPDTSSVADPQSQLGGNQPDLVVVASWMGGASRPIAKYTTGHATLFPNSSILLLRCGLQDFFVRRAVTQVANMAPAAQAIKAMVDKATADGRKLKVLVHVFSNGGSWTVCVLKEAYERVTAEALPVTAMVFDSAPSLPQAKLGHNAMMQALPKGFIFRLIGWPLFWFLIGTVFMMDKLHLQPNMIIRMRQVLNDKNGPFLGVDIPRTYICGKRDAMVPMEDVVAHAADARKMLGELRVTDPAEQVVVQEFDGNHVGHMMVDATRYWQVIKAIWAKVK